MTKVQLFMTNAAVKKTFVLNFLIIALLNGHAQGLSSTDIYYQTGKVQPVMAQYEADRASLSRFYVVMNSPEEDNGSKNSTKSI
jgi:hypothetical protein